MEKLLEGVRVVDFTCASAGPSCTKILAEYGAEVILVEPPWGSTTRINPHLFDFYTNGKKSLAMDMKTEKGKEAMLRLVKESDVFVHNFRNKAIEKLGLDYESLHKINPKLVWASLDGYGLHGPDKDLPGYDTVSFWSRSGMLADHAQKGSIMNPPLAVGDMAAGMALAGAVCGALYAAEKTGRGRKVYVSLYAMALYLNNETIVESQYGSSWPTSRTTPKRALLNTYKSKDDKWFTLLTTNFDKDFNNVLRSCGREDLIGDSRWKNIFDTMDEKAPELVAILDKGFAKFDRAEILETLKRYDIACAEVRTATDCYTDPQAFDNQYLFKYTTREGKEVITAASPVKIGSDDIADFSVGPEIGQDTCEILAICGYSDSEIDEMIREKVVAALQ